MRVVVITMVYNEQANLPIWVNYYGTALGHTSLLVLDHGSDDGSLEPFPHIRTMKLPRTEFSEIQRRDFISRLQQHLLGENDIVIYTDCDEILVPDPGKYADLRVYLEQFLAAPERLRRTVGLNLFHSRKREPPLLPWLPVLQQRSYCQFHSLYSKPILTKMPVTWQVGFHHCEQTVKIDPDLYLFHLRDRDYEQSLRRLAVTRQVKWHESDIKLKFSYHHRYSDAEAIAERFDAPERLIDEGGPLDFDFSREIARIDTRFADFAGPVAKIPERFKRIF